MGGLLSRNKGKRAERELALMFSKWWGVPNSFARTPDSGAFATRRKMVGQTAEEFNGDVFGPPECKLHIESKHHESWGFDAVVTAEGGVLPPSHPLAGWLRQAHTEARPGALPIVVFRKNRMPWMVAYEPAQVPTTTVRPIAPLNVLVPLSGLGTSTSDEHVLIAILRLDDFLTIPASAFGRTE